jgi:hypothetical protein
MSRDWELMRQNLKTREPDAVCRASSLRRAGSGRGIAALEQDNVMERLNAGTRACTDSRRGRSNSSALTVESVQPRRSLSRLWSGRIAWWSGATHAQPSVVHAQAGQQVGADMGLKDGNLGRGECACIFRITNNNVKTRKCTFSVGGGCCPLLLNSDVRYFYARQKNSLS